MISYLVHQKCIFIRSRRTSFAKVQGKEGDCDSLRSERPSQFHTACFRGALKWFRPIEQLRSFEECSYIFQFKWCWDTAQCFGLFINLGAFSEVLVQALRYIDFYFVGVHVSFILEMYGEREMCKIIILIMLLISNNYITCWENMINCILITALCSLRC